MVHGYAEKEIVRHHNEQVPLWWRVFRQIILFATTLFIFGCISAQFAPLNSGVSIVPAYDDGSLATDIQIKGWPLAVSATYWLEQQNSGKGGYRTSAYSIPSLVIDLALFYATIVLIGLLSGRSYRLLIQRYDVESTAERVLMYARYVFLIVFSVLLVYWILSSYISRPHILSGVPESGAPIPVQE